MSELVERVARAISQCCDPDECTYETCDEKLYPNCFCRKAARAAIEATDQMYDPVEPRPTTWKDAEGVEHPVVYTTVTYSEWRKLFFTYPPLEG